MNDKIALAKGPERIRRRAGIYFGSNDLEGTQQLVRTILEVFATEALRGHCKNVTVAQHGAKLLIKGDDRGLYLGQDKKDTNVWKDIFCTPRSDGISFSEEDGRWQLYCAQCVCKSMVVVSVRNGVKSTICFENGNNVGGILFEQTKEPCGTCFLFEVDRKVFRQVIIPSIFFLKTLKQLALLLPGLKCTYINEARGMHMEYVYPNGVLGYVKSCTQSRDISVYNRKIQATGKDRYNGVEYDACVEIAIAPTPWRGAAWCLHNMKVLTCGGTHYQQMQKQLCDALNEQYLQSIIGKEADSAAERAKQREENSLTFKELSRHLTIVLATWCPPRCTEWENATKQSISNRMIADMTDDAMTAGFRRYVRANQEELRFVIDMIKEERQHNKQG